MDKDLIRDLGFLVSVFRFQLFRTRTSRLDWRGIPGLSRNQKLDMLNLL
jgi:hypothetical protein